MKTFDSAADFRKYLESFLDPDILSACQPVILPEDIKYKGRGGEEIFEKGYIICSFGKVALDYCFECGVNGEKLKEAGGKIKKAKNY